jgi:hypothetical protein
VCGCEGTRPGSVGAPVRTGVGSNVGSGGTLASDDASGLIFELRVSQYAPLYRHAAQSTGSDGGELPCASLTLAREYAAPLPQNRMGRVDRRLVRLGPIGSATISADERTVVISPCAHQGNAQTDDRS